MISKHIDYLFIATFDVAKGIDNAKEWIGCKYMLIIADWVERLSEIYQNWISYDLY